MSPTIQVQAPDEELPIAMPTSLTEAVQGNQPHLLDGEPLYHNDTDATPLRLQVPLMLKLGILLLNTLPGFQWPSPPEGTWQQPFAPDNHYPTNIPQHPPPGPGPTQQQMFASLMHPMNQTQHFRERIPGSSADITFQTSVVQSVFFG
ncbi:hypothetical protein FRC04_004620 [Tulasnella sp. 424]|nr:hypothetical protein FRC04_004620 [Tulasnella sp. 424]